MPYSGDYNGSCPKCDTKDVEEYWSEEDGSGEKFSIYRCRNRHSWEVVYEGAVVEGSIQDWGDEEGVKEGRDGAQRRDRLRVQMEVIARRHSSDVRSFLEDAYKTSQASIEIWGREAQRWMVVEEGGEFLETFAKYRRGRATEEKVAEEGADRILTTIMGMATEDIRISLLLKHILFKLGRAKNRVAQARLSPEENPVDDRADVIVEPLDLDELLNDDNPRPEVVDD